MKQKRKGGRIVRERNTVEAMIALYCRLDHHREQLCPECRELRDYAASRLARCPFGEDKPTCLNCPVHCYAHQRRERMREVMRFSGPRMLRRHPVLAIRHLIDTYLDGCRLRTLSARNGEYYERKDNTRKDGN